MAVKIHVDRFFYMSEQMVFRLCNALEVIIHLSHLDAQRRTIYMLSAMMELTISLSFSLRALTAFFLLTLA